VGEGQRSAVGTVRRTWVGSEAAWLERQMATRPPVIVWRYDPFRKVQVALSVDDPYQDKAPARRTGCDRGHEYTPETVLLRSNGERDCRTCKRQRDRLSSARRRDAARRSA
jgi:hypothetical protein